MRRKWLCDTAAKRQRQLEANGGRASVRRNAELANKFYQRMNKTDETIKLNEKKIVICANVYVILFAFACLWL